MADAACTAITVPTPGTGAGGATGDAMLLDSLIKAVNADGFNGEQFLHFILKFPWVYLTKWSFT